MYCIECGKANPDGAKFCAFCGKKLFTGEDGQQAAPQTPQIPEQKAEVLPQEPAQEQTVETVQEEKPAVQPEKKPVVRNRNLKTLQPLTENPAQPEREWEKAAQPVAEEILPEQEIAPAVEIAPEAEAALPEEESVPQEFIWQPQNGPTKSLEEIWAEEDEREEKKPLFPWQKKDEPAEEEDGEDAPRRPLFSWLKRTEDDELSDEQLEDDEVVEHKFSMPWRKKSGANMVLTSTGEEEMPERAPVVVRKKRDTHIPQRHMRVPEEDEISESDEGYEEEDVFFQRPKKKRGDIRMDDAYVNRSVRRILFGIALVACLCAAIWLLATSGGSMFLAGFNLSGDAQAYRNLGDTALAGNQIKRAAEAYYRALALDPDDYETALLVGKTQQQIGEYDTAANAYYMCTTLAPNLAEPYEALIELYEIQNDDARADYFREQMRLNVAQ